jgi:hypothetical protein
LPHPTDGRTTLASITAKGRRTAEKASKALNTTVFAATGLAPKDERALFGALRKLRLAAGDFTD